MGSSSKKSASITEGETGSSLLGGAGAARQESIVWVSVGLSNSPVSRCSSKVLAPWCVGAGEVYFSVSSVGRGKALCFCVSSVGDGGRVFFSVSSVEKDGRVYFSVSSVGRGKALRFSVALVEKDERVYFCVSSALA